MSHVFIQTPQLAIKPKYTKVGRNAKKNLNFKNLSLSNIDVSLLPTHTF